MADVIREGTGRLVRENKPDPHEIPPSWDSSGNLWEQRLDLCTEPIVLSKSWGFQVLSPPFRSYCGDHKVKGRVPSFPLCQLDAEDYLGHTVSQGSNRRERRLPGERQHDLEYPFIGPLGGWENYCELRPLNLLATSSPQRGKPAYSSFPTQHPWDMQISSSASDLLASRSAGSVEGTQGHDVMAHSQPWASWHSPDGFSTPDTQADAVLSQGHDHEPFIKAASTSSRHSPCKDMTCHRARYLHPTRSALEQTS